MSAEKWYKVLLNGESFHGGSMKWSLPDGNIPGEWHEVYGDLRFCSQGLHVTNDPAHWFSLGARVYLTECEGLVKKEHDKACFRRVRLLRELDNDELRELRIAGDGKLTVTGNDFAFVFGSCEVTARDSSQVTAWESSQVEAWESSQVEAKGSGQITAKGSSTINIFSSKCSVTQSDQALVIDRTCCPPKILTGWKGEMT